MCLDLKWENGVEIMNVSLTEDIELVIITGMSGAGKTVAVRSFEDLGFFCVDNLPPALMPKFLELMKESGNKMTKVALVMDLRGREFFDTLLRVLDELSDSTWVTPKILFLDADDAALVGRYKETRRSHPLAPAGLPLEGIKQERNLLEDLKGRAQLIYNTSSMKPKELREKIYVNFPLINKLFSQLMSCLLVLNMASRLMRILFLMFVFAKSTLY